MRTPSEELNTVTARSERKILNRSLLESVTYADLCQALASGQIPAQVQDDAYLIARRDLLAFFLARTLPLAAVASPRPARRLARRAS